jgi:hypothetical protein
LEFICSGRKFLKFGGPKPPVDVLGQEIRTIATLEVAYSPGGPDVLYFGCK